MITRDEIVKKDRYVDPQGNIVVVRNLCKILDHMIGAYVDGVTYRYLSDEAKVLYVITEMYFRNCFSEINRDICMN